VELQAHRRACNVADRAIVHASSPSRAIVVRAGRLPDAAAPIVLYCGGGFRSALAADNLQKMGYTNVISMDGGIRDWREKGYPLTKGST
jgi:rhodanese-related sulfurtransferase